MPSQLECLNPLSMPSNPLNSIDPGIYQKDRNAIFEHIQKLDIPDNQLSSNYSAESRRFEVYVNAFPDLKFVITREKTDFNKYSFSFVYYKGFGNTGTIDRAQSSVTIKAIIKYFENWVYGGGRFVSKPSINKGIDVFFKEMQTKKEDSALKDLWTKKNDPILKLYQEEEYVDFEILEDDPDDEPFSPEQQLFLNAYLEKISDRLLAERTEKNANKIDPIQKDIKSIRDDLATKPKKTVAKKFNFLHTRIGKFSLKVLKEVYTAVRQELISMMIRGLIG